MRSQTEKLLSRSSRAFCRHFYAVLACGAVAIFGIGITAAAAQDESYKTAGGVSVYLGVVPAELVKGPESHSSEKPMHGGTPRGRHEYHVVAAIFDSASGARISDATVTAKVSGLGLSGTKKTLEAMKIADTITYGGFFYLPGADRYTISLSIQRPGSPKPVTMDFKYAHGR